MGVVVALLLGVALAACGSGSKSNGPDPTVSNGPDPTVSNGLDPTVSNGLDPTAEVTHEASEQAAVDAARADLAQRFSTDIGQVAVDSVTPKQWSNSCLDVQQEPQTAEPEVCAQVITPGFEVVLTLFGNRFTYHTNDSGSSVRFAGFALGGN